jgi:hypothetical protein
MNNTFKQNISVLPSKFVIISGVTFPDGNEIPLGVPSSGNFNGYVTGWSSNVFVTDAIDELNKKLLTLTSATATKSVLLFNSTTDWGLPTNGYYSISYLSSLHRKGFYPSYILEELIIDSYDAVMPDNINVNLSGDVVFRVIEIPDGRFSGRIIVT